MNPLFFLVFVLIAIIYGGINYYIGLKGWQFLFHYIPPYSNKVYWTAFWFISLAYLLSRLTEKYLPSLIAKWLNIIGSYWLAVMFYSLLIILAIDCLQVFNRIGSFVPLKLNYNPLVGLSVFLLTIGLVVYGAWNARHPVVKHYDIEITKQAGINNLHVVMVSDIHLGLIVDNSWLTKMVSMVNSLHPDVILFAGDIIDENVERVDREEIRDNFRLLKAPDGIYAVLGNHEYIGGHAEEAVKYLGEAGVKVLRDSFVEIADSIYIIGRDEQAGQRFGGTPRKSLADLMQGINRNYPVILLDHEPSNLEEPQQQGIDLQLSGHTHRGQLFPNQLITQRIYEDEWGLLKKGDFQIIVSSGFGTWGPPIRIGNHPEVVDINILFK